jgi:hypothetical protein
MCELSGGSNLAARVKSAKEISSTTRLTHALPDAFPGFLLLVLRTKYCAKVLVLHAKYCPYVLSLMYLVVNHPPLRLQPRLCNFQGHGMAWKLPYK